jgi:DNA-binding NarL/FixJ family response regulator
MTPKQSIGASITARVLCPECDWSPHEAHGPPRRLAGAAPGGVRAPPPARPRSGGPRHRRPAARGGGAAARARPRADGRGTSAAQRTVGCASAAKRAARHAGRVPVLPGDPQVVAEAFRSGARGYVLRSASGRELTCALRAVLRGERWLSPTLVAGNAEALSGATRLPGPLGRLSPRRREVVELLAEGHSMKQAAAALGITARTVAFHKYRAMKALAVTSSAQLVRCAFESRLPGAGGN